MAAPFVLTTADEVRAYCDRARAGGGRVAFVPTMGALHEGHVALVHEAARRASRIVVSIFVNPTQFGPGEDLDRYPRDLAGDISKLAAFGELCVFAPAPSEMYPPGDETRVRVGALAEPLCGRFRPGHFEGVATVVTKLFAIVGPCTAVFGRKDYQQLQVVRRLVQDLKLPVEVVGHATLRDGDGLAMSSRNRYLSPEERQRALGVVRGLDAAARAFALGERRARTLEAVARAPIESARLAIEYVEVRDAESLASVDDASSGRVVLAAAVRVGSTRLIDNLVLGEERSPFVTEV